MLCPLKTIDFLRVIYSSMGRRNTLNDSSFTMCFFFVLDFKMTWDGLLGIESAAATDVILRQD